MFVIIMLFILSFTLIFCNALPFASAEPLPDAPRYYVYDTSKAISEKGRLALESMIIEHDRLTGEQFMIAVFPADTQNTKTMTNQIFAHWKIGKRGQNNGILLSVFTQTQEAYITV